MIEDFKITKHFTFYEMTDSEKFPNLVEENRIYAQSYLKQLRYTCCTLEEIRAVLGVKLKSTSGIRCPKLNKAVGGSATSGHQKGLCDDFIPIDMRIRDAFDLIQANKHKCPSLKKCIYESFGGREWLHIETKTEANQPTQFFATTNGKTYTEIKG